MGRSIARWMCVAIVACALMSSGTLIAGEIRLPVGQSIEVRVNANEAWSITDIKMMANEVYAFSVAKSDTWKNGSCDPCTASGFTSGDCSDNILLTGTKAALMAAEGVRRAPRENWLCLMGELFDVTTGNLASLMAKAQFKIGRSRELQIPTTGMLVLFGNDQLSGYGDNSGSVKVKIKRIK